MPKKRQLMGRNDRVEQTSLDKQGVEDANEALRKAKYSLDTYTGAGQHGESQDFLDYPEKLAKAQADTNMREALAKPNSYKHGGVVKKSGIAKVHKGERVLTESEAHAYDWRKQVGRRAPMMMKVKNGK